MIKLTDEQVDILRETLDSRGGTKAFNNQNDFEEDIWPLNEVIDAFILRQKIAKKFKSFSKFTPIGIMEINVKPTIK